MYTNKTINTIHTISMGLAIVGVVLQIVLGDWGWVILAAASLSLFFTRLFMRAKTTDKNSMRQLSILLFGAVLLLGSAYLMYSGRRYWVVPLIIDSVLELYISLRMDDK